MQKSGFTPFLSSEICSFQGIKLIFGVVSLSK